MGGRFGKYGDMKRRQALGQMRREKFRLDSARIKAQVRRRKRRLRSALPSCSRAQGQSGTGHCAGPQPVDIT